MNNRNKNNGGHFDFSILRKKYLFVIRSTLIIYLFAIPIGII